MANTLKFTLVVKRSLETHC